MDHLQKIKENVRSRFDQAKRVMSFDEFVEFALGSPYVALRNSSHYILDAIQHYGSYETPVRGKSVRRWKLFDQPYKEDPTPLVAQENLQHRFIQILTSFTRIGKSNKLIVLHGPNGSAKSSFVKTLLEGIEHYSAHADGALFHFSWVFPQGSYEKSNLGIGTKRESSEGSDLSFARIDPTKIDAILRSELHENPLMLIPKEERKTLFDQLIKNEAVTENKNRLETLRDSFTHSELSHKNALIFEALLNEYSGDFRKVVKHVRIERLYLSKKFRKGLVTVEPQFGVDAHIRQVTLDRSMANLPPALQSLNLFQLEGDLIDGNRGLVEFNDFLKRPLEHFKYLLGTCESGSVNLGYVVAFLDTIFVATTDERHLDSFREHPEYGSFKSRLDFIKVPYLLRYTEEDKIYHETARAAAGTKELMPHTTKVLALWAVLTRLKKPNTKNKNTTLTRVLENLTPLAKAKLYDSGELPEKLSDDERRELKSHLEDIITEQESQLYYEGLLGASARELKVVIQQAAQNDQFHTLGPNAIIQELNHLIKRPMDFEYLRLEPNGGYHAFEEMISTVHGQWLSWVDREMRISLELQNETQLAEYLSKYISHITHFVRGEKIKNRITGRNEIANEDLMKEFEDFIGLSQEKDEFRKNLISRLGAWTVEHSDRDITKGLPYAAIFPDLIEKMNLKHHSQQVSKIKAMGEFLLDVDALATGSLATTTLTEAADMAIRAYRGLQERFNYGPNGAKEALTELIKSRYM